MINPILSMLNNNWQRNISDIGNPNKMFDQMMKNNPKFAKFVQDNKGKTPEEIARAYGIDPSVLKMF